MVEITSSSFKPTEKSQGSEFSGASGVVKVVEGSGGYNHWSFDVDATAFKPDEYIVKVSGIIQDVTGSTYFNIIPGTPPTICNSNNDHTGYHRYPDNNTPPSDRCNHGEIATSSSGLLLVHLLLWHL